MDTDKGRIARSNRKQSKETKGKRTKPLPGFWSITGCWKT